MITIVGYGLGNVSAFATMYRTMEIPARIATSASDLAGATHIILPGVGSFDHAMHLLDASGMRGTLEELVQDQAVPVLGVCVGMQILANASDEGAASGLGWIPGRICSLESRAEAPRLPLPHMGWNTVVPGEPSGLFSGMVADPRFYFLHSFYFAPEHDADAGAVADYGGRFACMVHRKNVYGVQFHPEKSHANGALLLKNFASL
jgi:imidazole glycerol-phosphate synthase subunit HisH